MNYVQFRKHIKATAPKDWLVYLDADGVYERGEWKVEYWLSAYTGNVRTIPGDFYPTLSEAIAAYNEAIGHKTENADEVMEGVE